METQMSYPLSFWVKPGKTLLGLDKNSAFCFVVPKVVASRVIYDQGLGPSKSIVPIGVTMGGVVCSAEFRWTVQDGSKPYKHDIQRSWGDGRQVLFIQFGSKRHEDAQLAIRALLADSFRRISRGQRVRGEILFVSINEDLSVEFEAF